MDMTLGYLNPYENLNVLFQIIADLKEKQSLLLFNELNKRSKELRRTSFLFAFKPYV